MLSVIKKELRTYLYSPMMYVIASAFVFIFAIFMLTIVMNPYGPMKFSYGELLYSFAFWLAFLIPVLTMRIFAEERKNGTDVLLMTSPLGVGEIVIGKFLASLTVYTLMMVITFVFPLIISIKGDLNLIQTVTSYLGLFLIGAVCVAFGLLTSAFAENQIIAAILGFVGIISIWILENIKSIFMTVLYGIIYKFAMWISLFDRFNSFRMGLINLKDIVFFISIVGMFIALTMIVIEKRRWSQG